MAATFSALPSKLTYPALEERSDHPLRLAEAVDVALCVVELPFGILKLLVGVPPPLFVVGFPLLELRPRVLERGFARPPAADGRLQA